MLIGYYSKAPTMSRKPLKLVPPCGYAGGKRTLAKQIIPHLLEENPSWVVDLCAGSGAITLALISAGVSPARIVMVEAGPWGGFYRAVAEGTLDVPYLEKLFSLDMPKDPRDVRTWVEQDVAFREPTPEHFLVVQAAAFGSVPVWWDGAKWRAGEPKANRSYRGRSYWEPGPDSPETKPRGTIFRPDCIVSRVRDIARYCLGMRVIHSCIQDADLSMPEGTVFYMDPPYLGTSGYGFSFNVDAFIERGPRPLFVSEGREIAGAEKVIPLKHRKGSSLNHRARGRGAEYLNKFGSLGDVDLFERMFF